MARKISKSAEGAKIGFVLFVLACAFFPLYVMLAVSFKSNEQYQATPWTFDALADWRWHNWEVAWQAVGGYISNSVFVSVTGTILTIVTVLLCSYPLARYRFPGRNLIYYGLLASMFLPGTAATLVTVFALLQRLSLVNNLWALILMAVVHGQITGVFLLKQYIEDIPISLFDSAEMDCAGHLQQIWHIVLPMSGPIISVSAIMSFLGTWNDVILPMIILRDNELLTIPVGLLRLEGEYVKNYGEMMAGYAIASVPLVLLFLFTMRFFVKGLSAGAIKG